MAKLFYTSTELSFKNDESDSIFIDIDENLEIVITYDNGYEMSIYLDKDMAIFIADWIREHAKPSHKD